MKGPILKGPRITLRPIKLSDAPNYVCWFDDKKVIKYLASQEPLTLKKEYEYIKNLARNKNNINYAIINEEKKHIGSAGFHEINWKDKRAVFGIVIGEKDQWWKGYAGECIKVLADYLFKKLKFNRFELDVSVANSRGVKAYKKAGFIFEGVKRKHHFNKVTKKFEDTAFMSILRADWLKK